MNIKEKLKTLEGEKFILGIKELRDFINRPSDKEWLEQAKQKCSSVNTIDEFITLAGEK